MWFCQPGLKFHVSVFTAHLSRPTIRKNVANTQTQCVDSQSIVQARSNEVGWRRLPQLFVIRKCRNRPTTLVELGRPAGFRGGRQVGRQAGSWQQAGLVCYVGGGPLGTRHGGGRSIGREETGERRAERGEERGESRREAGREAGERGERGERERRRQA